MDEFEFRRLIERYQDGALSPEEKAMVDRWFASLGDEAKDEQWTRDDQRRLGQKIRAMIDAREEGGGARRAVRPADRRFSNHVYRIAASLLIVAALSFWIWDFVTPQTVAPAHQLVATSTGDVNKVVLHDGTIVWLKGHSSLTYPQHFGGMSRRVSLSGEALFEVSKDPEHPFIIECGDLLTTVLGTSFNIRSGSEDIEVLVLTGKVSITSKTDATGVIVLPNEKALYSVLNKQIAKVRTQTPETETLAVVRGTEYPMSFEDTRMEEVIRRIEGKYSIDIVVSDPTLRNCVITADFTDEPLDRTLDMIAQALSIHYEVTNERVTLSGQGCP